jgi:hypothetical protein
MKFTSLLKNLITENSRFEILFDTLTKPTKTKEGVKTAPKLSEREFFELVYADPTTRTNNISIEDLSKENFDKIKAGKYVNWLIKNFLTPQTESNPDDYNYNSEVRTMKDRFLEDLYKVTDDLKKFERFKNRLPEDKRDINKMTPNELYQAVKDFDLTLATTTKSERKTAQVHPGAKIIFDGNNWRVVQISDKTALGKEAACFYGGNQKETRWCTSAPGLQWFEKYIKDGPLYVIYDPKNPKISPETGLPVERYQFHFESNQFMDKDDGRIDLVSYLNNEMSELKNLFKPYFASALATSNKGNTGSVFEVTDLKSGAVGKFISLYGLNELIENLPDDLEEFKIMNKDKNNILINIPESIGRFKNIRRLFLENCIDRVPDAVCELKNLRFISFTNNDKLRTVPECIADLPNILFLNLKDCKNITVPEKIIQKSSEGVELEGGLYDFSDIDD